MPALDSSGVQIHYETFGDGPPIVLVHGFASNLQDNWVRAGWVDVLSPVRRVIALDCRGHGESGKPYEPDAYARLAMANDVIALMDHLSIERAELFGYSMGAAISLRLITNYPERFTKLVLGGAGSVARRTGGRPGVAEALLSDDPSRISDATAKGFRVFAERMGNDLKALAALQQAPRQPIDQDQLARIEVPTLVVVGENDNLATSADELAAAIPDARLVTVPGKDHLTVVAHRRFKDAVLEFLTG